MYSVTGRINSITQPYGGYVKPQSFTITPMATDTTLHPRENLHGSLVGLAVDYLTRVMLGTPPIKAFDVSLYGAIMMSQETYANIILDRIKDLSDESIIAACKLVVYDTPARAGLRPPVASEDIHPDKHTIENIRTMVERSLQFFSIYGPVTQDGFTMEGGYTDLVDTGDGDFLTHDTLWDLKVLRSEINSKHTLQVLMYYIMGKRSIHPVFDTIDTLGFFNPRLAKVYTLKVCDIAPSIIEEVSIEIIGYHQ